MPRSAVLVVACLGLALGADGTWSAVDTGEGGVATDSNGYLAFSVFTDLAGEALYASYWNADTPAVATIRKTTDGTTWTTDYTGADGTLRPFIVLTVDRDQLFAIGGRVHRIKQSARCGSPGLRFRPRRSRRQ